MQSNFIPICGTLLGTLLGTWLGYRLSFAQTERTFRRTVLRDIAFEYRKLADLGTAGGVQGLIRAGILQCKSDREFSQVLELVDDLSPAFPLGEDWRPVNKRYREFFRRLEAEGINPTNGNQLRTLKKEIETA